MTKIPTVREMEELLLRDSTTDDLMPGMPDKDMPEKQITTADVKHDISVLARLLIRAYVGWPVHSEIIKRKVLKNLVDIYNNAHDMTAMEFFEQLKSVLSYIPDNHISLRFNRQRVGTHKTRKAVNVGKNIAGDKQITTQMKKGIAIIGFTRMLRNDDFANTILEFAKNTLPKSTALIIDLRGNGGGNSFYSDKFSEHLCGTWIDSMKEVYVRATPEAKKLQHAAQPNAGWKDVPESEELTLWKAGKNYTANPEKAYMKPIYILTDGQTGSSAEMFLLRMIHHPCVHVVGDNSAGMEEYGNMANSFLPHSQITVAIGMNYRKLLQEDFELNGHKPNIKCPDGTDAFAVAMTEIEKSQDITIADTRKIKDKACR